MSSHQEILTKYLAAFVTGLVEAGVQDVVISPGSRSTPLALLMAEHRELNVYIQVDERSASFFALGLAKASNRPVALLCTSGTAAANFYPAVIEADLSRVPLIVLTADRPHELRDVGAPQAMDQIHLYGHHVRWFFDMPLPEKELTTYAKTMATRAVMEAQKGKKGPVHLNFPFREPLIPNLSSYPFDDVKVKPISTTRLDLDNGTYEKIAQEVSQYERGLIVCGAIYHPGFSEAVIALAEKLNFPILADPLSQLRSQGGASDVIIDSYDAILKSEDVWPQLEPEIIIRFGQFPVSKPLSLFLRNYINIPHMVVDGGAGWRDPYHLGTEMIYADEELFCEKLAYQVEEKSSSHWLHTWQRLDGIAKEMIAKELEGIEELDEGKAVYIISKFLPETSTLFVGNSMPIRDVDTFFHKDDKGIQILANRGANGIDGVVSTALGVSVYNEPTYLLIGDLSFFHDQNGLLAAKQYGLNLKIIILNNDGGGIFSYLPQARQPKHFELLFGTPTGLKFEHIARLYDAQYKKVTNWDELTIALEQTREYHGLQIIEVPTNREQNLSNHRKIWDRISREINDFFFGDSK